MVSTEGGTGRWGCSLTGSPRGIAMGKKVLCALKGYFRLIVFLLLITGSIEQIILDPFDSANTQCTDGGVVDGKDQVVMVGFVTANGTMSRDFDFYRTRVGDTTPIPVCSIKADKEGCDNQSTALCYCQEKSGNTYTVVYNRTADLQDSNAILTLYHDGDSSGQQLPIVHSVGSVAVTIAGGESNISLSTICSQQIYSGKTYDFEICEENLEEAEFYIGTNAVVGPWKKTIDGCSSFNNLTAQSHLTFAYRETHACLRSDSVNCTLSDKGELDEFFDETLIIIVVVVSVVAVLLVVSAVAGVICWKKHKREKYKEAEHVICSLKTSICVSENLKRLEQILMTHRGLDEKKKTQLPHGKKVFVYKGKTEYDKNITLKDLFPECEGFIVIKVQVFNTGKFEIMSAPEIVKVEIIIDACNTLTTLERLLKQDLQTKNYKLSDGEKDFVYKGRTKNDKSMRLMDVFRIEKHVEGFRVQVSVRSDGRFVIKPILAPNLHAEIVKCEIKIDACHTLITLERLLMQDLQTKNYILSDGKKDFVYKGRTKDDKSMKLMDVFGIKKHVDGFRVKVSVRADGTFVIEPILA